VLLTVNWSVNNGNTPIRQQEAVRISITICDPADLMPAVMIRIFLRRFHHILPRIKLAGIDKLDAEQCPGCNRALPINPPCAPVTMSIDQGK